MSRMTRQPRGFTLLELVLVMLILTVLMAMVAPTLSGAAKGRRTGDAATQLVAIAYYARSMAVTEGRTYRLNLDSTNNVYWLTVQDAGAFVDPVNGWGAPNRLPDGVRMQTDAPQQQDGTYLVFRSTGRVDPCYIRLTDEQNNISEIACESATELFRILRPDEPSSRRP